MKNEKTTKLSPGPLSAAFAPRRLALMSVELFSKLTIDLLLINVPVMPALWNSVNRA